MMGFGEFKRLAVKARWCWKRHMDDELLDLLSILCMGDRDVSYSLIEAWACYDTNPIYRLKIESLYDLILLHPIKIDLKKGEIQIKKH